MTEKGSIAVTVDIEDWYHIPSVCGSPFSIYKDTDEFLSSWSERYDYLSEPTYKILEIFKENGIRATFFIVSDVIRKYPGLVSAIADAGHELACHGLDHSCVLDPRTKAPLMTKDEFEKRTLKAKREIEDVYGKEVIGYRAPNALISGWMIDSLEDMGFRYDSSVSLNSLYNKTDSSLKGVGRTPYYPIRGGLDKGSEERSIIEFPFSYLDVGVKIPSSGGPFLRFLGSRVVYSGLMQNLKEGDAIFYTHPIDISQEAFPEIGSNRPLYWSIKGNIVERRIRWLMSKIKKEECHPIESALQDFHNR